MLSLHRPFLGVFSLVTETVTVKHYGFQSERQAVTQRGAKKRWGERPCKFPCAQPRAQVHPCPPRAPVVQLPLTP